MGMLIETPSVPAILGILIPLLILDVVVVVLRFYARRHLGQSPALDDWLTLPSLILILACSSIMFYGIHSRTLGYRAAAPQLQERSPVDASDRIIVTSRKLEYAFLCIVAPTLGLVKLSVLFLYRRLFIINKRFWDVRNIVLSTMIIAIFLWSVSYTFTFIFLCKGHFEVEFYDSEAAMKQCVNTLDVGYSYSISDFITDALIVLIPIPLIWRLHLPLAQRLWVMGIFLLGLLATAASLIRLIMGVWARHVGYDPSLDEELMLTQELFWCLLEVSVALLAACLPTLRALLKMPFVDSIVGSVRGMFSSLRSESSSTARIHSDSEDSLRRHRMDQAHTVGLSLDV